MRRTLITLALAGCGLTAQAANLNDLYQQARRNDATYAAAHASYKADLEKLPQGKSLLLPSVNLTASATHSKSENSATSNWSETNPYGYTLSLSQTLYSKESLASYEQAKLQALLAEQQLRLAEQDLILRVAGAYFAVLEADDQLATVRTEKAAIAEQLALAQRSFEVGVATIVDTHEAQARFDAALAAEIAAENTLEVKRRGLETLIAAEAPALDRLAPGITPNLPQPNSLQPWLTQAETGSLAVSASQTQNEIARREVDKQRGGYWPSVGLGASFSDSRNTSTSLSGTEIDTKNAKIGVEVAWNLFQGGATDSRLREAVARQEKARFELDAARRKAVLDTREAFLGVISGDARVRALDRAVTSGETQLKSTKLGLEVGVRTGVDVLNAQQQLFSARSDLASARYDALLSSLKLKAAAGSLGEEDLKTIDQHLQSR